MAMTKKRISGILLAVALFVGVFAATPAFAATTTTVKEGITIDWVAETLSWNGNLSVKIGDAKPLTLSGPQKALIGDFLGSDLKISVTDLSVAGAEAKTFTLPARPKAPEGVSDVNGQATDLISKSMNTILVNSPAVKQDYAIKKVATLPANEAYTSEAAFAGLLPGTDYSIYTRIAPVVGESFASQPYKLDGVCTADVDTYYIYSNGDIGYADGYKLYANTKFDSALEEGKEEVPAGSSAYVKADTLKDAKTSIFYLKKKDATTYITINYARPAAPTLLPTFILTYDNKIKMAETEGFAGYEYSIETTPALENNSFSEYKSEGYSTEATVTYIFARLAKTETTMASEPVLVASITRRPDFKEGVFSIDTTSGVIVLGSKENTVPVVANTKLDFTGETVNSGDSILELIYSGQENLWFRNPANGATPESLIKIGKIAVAQPAVTPEIPAATSTEETITITTPYISGIEFSIDGTKWQDSKVFGGLEDGKEYTVYARTAGNGDQFPSKPAAATIKTVAKKVVTFKNGDETVATQKYLNGAALAYPTAPTKEGYTFAGWDVAEGTAIKEDTTVNAKWDINKFVVTFKSGEAVVGTQNYDYNSKLVYPAAPKKTGYKFAGWDVAAGTAVTADMTVNAKWTMIKGLKSISKTTGTLKKISARSYTLRISRSKSSVKVIANKAFSGQKVKTYFGGKTYKTNYKTVKLAKGASRYVKFRAYAANGSYLTYTVKVVRNK